MILVLLKNILKIYNYEHAYKKVNFSIWGFIADRIEALRITIICLQYS